MKFKLMFLGILLLGLFLRVYDLGGESLWTDEGTSIAVAHLQPLQVIEERASDFHTPFYFVMLHYWIKLFGDSEAAARSLSVIFGFLSLLMMYRIAALIFNKETALLSLLIFALSVLHISYSQEVRMYSLAVFLTLGSLFFFLRLFKKMSFANVAGYCLFTIFMLYTHYSVLCIVLAQNIYFFTVILFSGATPKPDLKKWVAAQVALIILFMPWIPIALRQIMKVQEGYWIPTPSLVAIVETFKAHAGSAELFVLFLLLAFFSALRYKKTAGRIDRKDLFGSLGSCHWSVALSDPGTLCFLSIWLLTPILLPFIISRVSTPIYCIRYTIVASPAFYLLVAKGISEISGKHIKRIVICAVILLSLANIHEYYSVTNKEEWRDVAGYIEANAGAEDLVLVHSTGEDSFAYYFERADVVCKRFPAHTKYVNESNIGELREISDNFDNIWLIICHSHNPRHLIQRALSNSYRIERYKEYVGIEVYLYSKNITAARLKQR